ncbi:GNAT family N-acetyltransferase [Persicobacter diffluens]|uniref:N-acetyltransferase n=1 Tax=Persicobacter diffluens TaxID=981 RepID=A0AAN4W204_9BACT|nr:N-acetyltransferase [Persicobacter diffluens]
MTGIKIVKASSEHMVLAGKICEALAESAQQRGTGIATRSQEYIEQKLSRGRAVLALDGDKLAGFSYIEVWGHERFVANSGLIVLPDYRKYGLGKKIKSAVFKLSRELFPDAKIFGITTSLAVMKINSDLGYKPVTFSELTDDPTFWQGCQSCKNFDILQRNEQKMCLCTGMLFDPKKNSKSNVQKAIDKIIRVAGRKKAV